MRPKAKRSKADEDPEPDWQLRYLLSDEPLPRRKRNTRRIIGRTPEGTSFRVVLERRTIIP